MAADLIGLLRSRGLQPVYQAATHGGEHACPCPLCGGRDRFRIWPGQEGGPACSRAGVPGTWYCRQCGRGAPLRLRVRRSDEDAAAWGDKYMVVEGSAMPALLAGEDPRAVEGLTGTSYTYAAADELADSSLGRLNTTLRFELESVRDGLVSFQRHNRTVLRAG
jgi:hypothetical protein